MYAGQPVGILVAITQELAISAADDVVIKYTTAEKPLMTIKQVLDSGQKQRIRLERTITPTTTGSEIFVCAFLTIIKKWISCYVLELCLQRIVKLQKIFITK